MSTGNFKRILVDVDARTIASDGGGTPATLTLTPASDVVLITCNDPDGCTLTMGEPTLLANTSDSVLIVNVSANPVTLADSAGVVELASSVSLAQWESLSLQYVTDRWIERSRSTGSGTGAPTNASYLTGATNATLSAERVVTDTSTVAWDLATAGQAKANVPDASITLAKQANLATDRLIGRDTAGSGVPEALTVGGGVEFTGSGGIQRSALTGDVTASAGSASTTIANDAVTYAKQQNVSAASRLIGRGSASGSGDPEEISLGAGLSMAGTSLSSTVVGTGGGDVVGPSSATDNAVARYDGTTGKLLQNTSALTIADDGTISFPDGIKQTFNPNGTNAGINVGAQAGDPSSLADGDLWLNSSGTPALKARVNGATVNLVAGGGLTSSVYLLYREEQAQNTAGGTFTSGAWRTRVINTEVTDVGALGSLSSNQITLTAGTYLIRATAPAWTVNRHQARLQNVTDATTVLIGTSAFSSSSGTGAVTESIIAGLFTIGASKALEIQHQCQTTESSDGFGVGSNFTTEVYTVVELWKIG